MRRAWWVAILFLIPSLALSLLVNAALTLKRGVGSPVVWIGLFVLPIVVTGTSLRDAFARGLFSITALCLLFAAVVHLRLWTGAGGPVLEREGLIVASRWGLVIAVMAGLAGYALLRKRRETGAPAIS